MDDVEFRVDQAFSTAVQDQIDEQRAIRKLVSRVDESLVALSDGLVDLSGQLRHGTLTPEDLEQTRAELAESISRVERSVGGVAERLPDVDAPAVEDLIARTRADLLEALSRLERAEAPVAEAVEDTRREVRTSLDRLAEVAAELGEAQRVATDHLSARIIDLDERRESGLDRAVERLEQAIAAVAEQGSSRWSDAAARLDQAVSELADARSRDRDALQAALNEAAAASRAALAAAVGEAEQLVAAAEERLAAETGRSEEIATRATDVIRETMASAERVVAELAGQADRGEEAAQRAVAASREAVEAITASAARTDDAVATLNSSRDAAEEILRGTLSSVERELAQAVEQISHAATDRAGDLDEVAERVAALTTELQPQLRGAVDDIAGRIGELLQRNERATADAIAQAAALQAETLARALDDNGDAAARQAERFADAAMSTAARTEAVIEQAMAEMLQTQAGGSEAISAAAERLAAVAEGFQPAIDGSLTELRGALERTAAADRDRVEEAIERLQQAARTARDDLLDSVSRATQHLAATQADSLQQLLGVSAEVGRIPEIVEPGVLAGVDQLQVAVAQAVTDLREETSRSAQDARRALLEATEQARRVLTEARGSAEEAMATAAGERLREEIDGVAGEVEQAWTRLIEAHTTQADRVDGAASELARVVAGLESSLSTSIDGIRAALGESVARDRDVADASLADLAAASTSAASSIHDSAAGVETATSELQEAIDHAVRGIESLLERSESAAADRIHQFVGQMRDALAEQREQQVAQGEAAARLLDLHAAKVESATAAVQPLIEQAIGGVTEELRQAALDAVARLEGPLGDVTEVSRALEPALDRMLGQFRESLVAEVAAERTQSEDATRQLNDAAARLEEMGSALGPAASALIDRLGTAIEEAAASNRDATAEVAREAQDVLVHAVAEVRDELARQLDAATAVEPRMAEVVEQLRRNLLEEAAAERTRADASLTMLRESVAEAIGTLQDEVATTRLAAGTAATELQESTSRARDAVDEGVAQVAREMGLAMTAHLEELFARLRESGADQARNTRVIHSAAKDVSTAIDAAVSQLQNLALEQLEALEASTTARIEADRAHADRHREDVAAQVEAQLADARARSAQALEESTTRITEAAESSRQALAEHLDATTSAVQAVAETLATKVAETFSGQSVELAERVGEASTVVDAARLAVARHAEQIDTAGASISAQLTAATRSLGDRLGGEVEHAREALRADTTAMVAAAQHHAATLAERAAEMASLEDEAAQRVGAVVEDATRRLSDELARLRDDLRRAVITATDTGAGNMTRVAGEVDRLVGELERHANILHAASATQDSTVAEEMAQLRQGIAAELHTLAAAVDRARAGDAEQAAAVHRLAEDLSVLPDRLVSEVAHLIASAPSRTDHSELTDAIDAIRTDVAESLAESRRAAAGTLFVNSEDMTARLDSIEQRLGETLARLGEDAPRPDTALMEALSRRLTLATEERAAVVGERIDALVVRLDRAEELGAEERARAAAAIEALRQGADGGTAAAVEALGAHLEAMLADLRARTEEAMQRSSEGEQRVRDALLDRFTALQGEGMARLDEATTRLVALGPRLERQTTTRVDDIVRRVVEAISQLAGALQRVEHLDQKVDDAVRRAVGEARRTVASENVQMRGEVEKAALRLVDAGDQIRELQERYAQLERTVLARLPEADAEERTEAFVDAVASRVAAMIGRRQDAGRQPWAQPHVPPPVPISAATVCPDCGWTARTPPGLAAHRQTCEGPTQ